MRLLISSLTLLSFFWPAMSLPAQTAEPPVVPGARVPGQKTAEEKLYAEDGGARGGTLESIIVPPKAKAPFSLILETVWARGLADGGTITLENKRRIARDSEGRIYMERWLLVPQDGKQQPRIGSQTFTVTNLILSDPDPQLFDLPGGYTVIDDRKNFPPEN